MPFKPPSFRPARPAAPAFRPDRAGGRVHDPFYHTAAWRRLAEQVKRRDGYRCTEPNCPTPERGFGGRLIAGHIKPRHQDRVRPERDHPSNIRTFCPACDNRWHAEKGRLEA